MDAKAYLHNQLNGSTNNKAVLAILAAQGVAHMAIAYRASRGFLKSQAQWEQRNTILRNVVDILLDHSTEEGRAALIKDIQFWEIVTSDPTDKKGK